MNFKLLTILFISLGFIAGCGEDKVKVSLFVGDYVITEALVAEEFTIPVNVPGAGLVNIPVPVGTDITAAIQALLLKAVLPCTADKSYVELREDFSIWLSCEGANPKDAGTWSEVSVTELMLNLNPTAVPPIGIALPVTEVVKSGTILTGNATVPFPKAFIAAIIAPLTLEASALPIYNVKISLKFTQK